MGKNDPSPTAGERTSEPAPAPAGDAERRAALYLEEWRGRVNELAAARLRELADVGEVLRDWVEETNRQLDRLSAELTGVSRTDGSRSATEDGTARSEEGETSAADAAHLVAMQMAVRGASRDEVDQYLRDVFEMRHTADILDRAFAE